MRALRYLVRDVDQAVDRATARRAAQRVALERAYLAGSLSEPEYARRCRILEMTHPELGAEGSPTT